MGSELTVVSKHRSTNPKKLQQILRGDLDWIVMKALEKERNRRYESASMFAADVGRYLAGDVVFARSPSITYRMRKFARRNKGAFATATMILLALVAGTTVSTWQAIVASRERDRAVEAESDAKQQKERAEQALKETRKTIDKYVETIQNAELLKEERFKPLMKELLNDALAHYLNFIEKHEHDDTELNDLAQALYRVARVSDRIGNTDKAIEAYRRTIGIRKKLVEENPTVTEYQSDLALSHHNIGNLYSSTGNRDEALVSHRKAFVIREKLAAENPTVTEYRFGLAVSHGNIGNLHLTAGQLNRALVSLKKAEEILEKLVEEKPEETGYQFDLVVCLVNLGNLYGKMGQPHEARRSLEKAFGIQERLVAENPRVSRYRSALASIHEYTGNDYVLNGRPDEGFVSYEKAIKIRVKLVQENPTVTEYQGELARSHKSLADLYRTTGKPNEAWISYKKALEIREKLVEENPTVTKYQSLLAVGHGNIGIMCREMGQPDEALQSHRKALEILERLVAENPRVIEFQGSLAVGYSNIGIVYNWIGQPDEALVSYKKAIGIQEKLVEKYPATIRLAIDLGGSYVNRANLADSHKDYEAATIYYNLGVQTLEKVVKSNPRHTHARLFLGNAYGGRATLMQHLDRFEESVADAEKAVEYATEHDRGIFTQRLALILVAFATTEKYELAYNQSQKLAARNKTQAEFQYILACAISLTSATAKRDKTLASNERTERASRYSREAIGLLKTVKDLGFFKDPKYQKLIQSDPGLDALREIAEFQELLKEIAANPPAEQKTKREKNASSKKLGDQVRRQNKPDLWMSRRAAVTSLPSRHASAT